MKIDLEDRRLLIAERVFRVLGPVIRGGNDDPLGKRLLAGGGEEAVDVTLVDALVGRKALALDGVVFRRPSGLRHQINAGILAREAKLRRADLLGPVRVEPHVAVQIGVAGLEPKVGADQLLKVRAFLPLGLRSGTVLGKDVLKCARHEPLLAGCRS